MMRLLISLTSPYARMTRIAVPTLGLGAQIDMRQVNHRGFDETLLSQNPIGKVPTLTLDSGVVLYDSRVIIEYLYDYAGKSEALWSTADRYAGLTRQSLCLAMLDCTIAAAVEKRNHETPCQHQGWIERQEGKVARALGHLEAQQPAYESGTIPAADEIALACALGYLDFMMDGAWRAVHSALVTWLNSFEDAVPAFQETVPPAAI